MNKPTTKQSFLIALVLAFGNSLAYDECGYCKCCKGGSAYCNNQRYCRYGCMNGYFSQYCTHACKQTCKTCDNIQTCITCKDGYYNGWTHNKWTSSCEFSCSIGCLNSNCKSYGGTCSCKQNFTGGKCDSCVPKKYGSECNIPCPKVCANNFCKFNGDCYNCIQGLAGDKCDRCSDRKYGTGCHLQCPLHCGGNECYMNGTCINCVSGFAGSKCTKCIDGYYGDFCNIKCSFGCLNNKCERNGDCLNCKPGFMGNGCNNCVTGKFGSFCNEQCSKGCIDQVCKKNGDCECKTGFFGSTCSKCVAGKYGVLCDRICPSGCYDRFCDINGHCHWCPNGYSGNICDECSTGKYGTNCTETCSRGCANYVCERNGSCSNCRDRFIGTNCGQCIDGMYGVNCYLKCPNTCNSCVSMSNCTSCKRGHWGDTCKPCQQNCLDCSSDSECLSCENGFYGQSCGNRCNKYCFGNMCNKTTGDCINECIVGYYGKMCDKNCSSTCNDTKCGRQFGECLEGCQPGYTGKRCNIATEQSQAAKTKSDFDVIKVVAGIGAGLLALITVAIIIILVKRRQRKNKSDDNTNVERKRETSPNSETHDTNLTVEINHASSSWAATESLDCNIIEDTDESTKKTQELDDIYAKPIKPKRKTKLIESSARSSQAGEDNSFSENNKQTNNDKAFIKTNKNSFAVASTLESNTQSYNMNEIHKDNDVALEIEEDVEFLTRNTSSTIIETQIRKPADLDATETYYNVGAVLKRKIKVEQLSDFVLKKTDKDFDDEFQTLPPMLIKPYLESQKRENVSKNRYKGIYPYDDTRVVLKGGESDYINASYIDGYNKNKAYIASIGPTTKYMGDMSAFWMMVWQEKVEKIVMLTNLSEGGVPKCDKYWPDKDFSLTFGNIQVTCKIEEEYSDYTFRTFIVQKESVKRTIFHIHFTAWPDKGTPDDVTCLIEFRQKVVSTKTQLDGPLLVHCSAGIGRTGTYIALDGITKEGKAEREVDIFAFVRNMREQRVNMIQTAEQYKYLHNALVHTLTFDSDAIEASKFSDFMKTHTEDHLRKMFEKLQVSTEQRSDNETEAVKTNKNLKDKNREGADIPGDRYRPRLYIARSSGSSDYINAVYVNSFQNVNRFLMTKTPLPETVEDFLTLILQEKVSCIISMETSSPNDKNVGVYYPADNKTLKKGVFTVKTECGNGTDQYLSRKLKISCSSKSGSEDVTVPYIQFAQWRKGSIIPEEPATFVQFVKDMELNFCGIDKKRPVLVHCSTGAVRSGLFCVVSILLEKTQIDQRVSVVNTVRQIKSRRHLVVPNKDQFIFCHQCVNEYLRTFDTYSNFELKT